MGNLLIEVWYLRSVLTVETKKVPGSQQLIPKKQNKTKNLGSDNVKKYTLLGMEADKCVKQDFFFINVVVFDRADRRRVLPFLRGEHDRCNMRNQAFSSPYDSSDIC